MGVLHLTKYQKAVNFIASDKQVYQREICTIKKYGHDMYKLTCHKVLREAGWEQVDDKIDKNTKEKNTEKLENNISRAKSRVFEIAFCNDWDYFITCTLDQQKYDRTDLRKFRKDLAQFIRDQRKKYQADIRYILIPELHSDGRTWHMHGLIGGIKDEMVEDFDDTVPYKLRVFGYKNYPDYQKKFGFVSLGVIQNKNAVSKYITKYVNKNMDKSVTGLGCHMYYCSRGLNRAVKIKQGILRTIPQWHYENEWVKIYWFSEAGEVDKYIM